MKTLKILLVAGLLVLPFAGCKKDEKKSGDEKPADMGADMATPPADDMKAPGDMAAPAGDMAAPAGDMAAPAAADVGADLDKILEKQKAQYESMKGIKTLDDIKAKMAEAVKMSVEVFEMQLASLKKAAALPKDQLKAYMDKATKMAADNAQLGKDMIALQADLMKIKGAKKLVMDTNKEIGAKMKPLLEEYMKLQKEVAEKLK